MNIDAINAAAENIFDQVHNGASISDIIQLLTQFQAKKPIGKIEGMDDETDKITKELDVLFKKHIGKMFGSLEAASIKYFLETGTINGSFRFRLSAMIAEVVGKQTPPKQLSDEDIEKLVEKEYPLMTEEEFYNSPRDFDYMYNDHLSAIVIDRANYIKGFKAALNQCG